jgi:HPt (histidine-containing phosphotransfer) domain-containing protein
LRRTERPGLWNSTPTTSDISYEDVRQSFLIRLHSEQIHLAFLADALDLAQIDPTPAFANLEVFAHRLRGAAAVFGLPELRDDSKALELAAGAAAVEHSPFGEPQVQQTMRILRSRLICLNECTPLSNVVVLPTPAN